MKGENWERAEVGDRASKNETKISDTRLRLSGTEPLG